MQLLVVDDDPLVRLTVTASLEDLGFEVAEAGSGEEAMQRFSGGLGAPIVVTDIDLGPGWSGIELADRLHDRWPDLGVVLMSGRPERLRARGARAREAHLGKPFTLRQLEHAVRCLAAAGGPDLGRG